MLKFLANIQTRTRLQRYHVMLNKQFKNWEQIVSIALIIHADEQCHKNDLDKFLGKLKKQFEVFYVEPKSKTATHGDWQCITAGDINFLHLPKAACLEKLHQKTFDLVLNTGKQNDLLLQNIGAALKSDFKCAAFDHNADSNLVISRDPQKSLLAYLDEVVKYLNMIKN